MNVALIFLLQQQLPWGTFVPGYLVTAIVVAFFGVFVVLGIGLGVGNRPNRKTVMGIAWFVYVLLIGDQLAGAFQLGGNPRINVLGLLQSLIDRL